MACGVLREPHVTLGIDLKATARAFRGGRGPGCDFFGFVIDPEDSPQPAGFIEPDISLPIEVGGVGVGIALGPPISDQPESGDAGFICIW